MTARDSTGLSLTRWRDLLIVAVIAGVIGYLLLRWNHDRWPPLPRLAFVPALGIGIAELIGAGLVTRRLAGRGPRLEPLIAARTMALGKATALAAAAWTGAWVGAAIFLAPQSGLVVAARDDLTTALLAVGGGIVMAVGALVLERCLRTPEKPDDTPPGAAR